MVPTTPVPATLVPSTLVPSTLVPSTPVPATLVPSTLVPLTGPEPLYPEFVVDLIDSLYSRMNKMRNSHPMLLPIQKIKNINVEVGIIKINENIYEFIINSTEFKIEGSLLKIILERAPTDVSTEFFLRRILHHVLKVLKNINIDNLHGRFVAFQTPTQLSNQASQWVDFYQEFKDDKNIVLKINECCVCFMLTETITNCGHAICLECISILKKNVNINYKCCPMCRQQILKIRATPI
jgi:hypothetical protein